MQFSIKKTSHFLKLLEITLVNKMQAHKLLINPLPSIVHTSQKFDYKLQSLLFSGRNCKILKTKNSVFSSEWNGTQNHI